MIVTNVKLGYATNSSSSHSIVISPYFTELKDKESGDFNWNYFVAHSKKSKINYLASLLHDQLESSLDNAILSNFIMKDWLGEDNPEERSSIDHQSTFFFPCTFGTNEVDKQFFNDFKKFILRDDVAILGGNDNGGDAHPVLEGIQQYQNISNTIPFIKGYGGKYYCRKDGEFWTLFTAGKEGVRFTFCYDDFVKPMLKYEAPLLVDLKITDFCTTNCSFCYQSSTKKGKHASFESIKECLDVLSSLKVFEVAIGGGNPVSHPNFVEILEYAKSKGITPNFSTRDVSFLDNKEMSDRILRSCGNFAFSVDPNSDMAKLEEMLKKVAVSSTKHEYSPGRFMNFQAFIGPGGFDSGESLEPLMELAFNQYRTVTFLGYKNVGRAKTQSKNPTEGDAYAGCGNYAHFLPEFLKKLIVSDTCPKVGIDTVLVKELQYSLKNLLNVSDYLFSVEEGKGSCYIDLVKKIIAPSSFDQSQTKYGDMTPENIKRLFATF